MLRGSALWGSPAAEPDASTKFPSICIIFRDHLTLSTKSYSFAGIVRSDALTLENLRELTACREKAYESSSIDPEGHLSWIQRYFALLTNFAGKAAAIDGNNEHALQFEWTSPLGGFPASYYRVKGVVAEQAMACITYAAALEKEGYAIIDKIAQQPIEELQQSAEQHVAAALLFRKAAGVYDYAALEFVDALEGPQQADRPAELRQGMPSVLAKQALGQAQAVTAHRAEVKGTSPAALASLYCGVIDLFEEASREVRSNENLKQTSESLRKALALSSNFHKVKAWQAMAAQELLQQDPGLACADLQEARRLAQESSQVAQGKPEWQRPFQHQLSLIDEQMVVYDRERQVVYFQAISKHCSKLPAGKILVKPVHHEPLQLQHELG